ncbi:MAG TPA: histidinol-phosphate transaminase [Candidatus Saccharimonadales bacterium]|nr:histidinol-phosphate transaminase [Candidatus Saccharimonadales bacterium]
MTKLRARRTVETLKEYHPPLGGRDGLRLDFNENVDGCSPRVLDILHSITSETLNRYPEREPGEQATARHLGATPEHVLLTNGVDEAIHLLAETYLELGDETLIAVPTFSMYEIYALATGATVRSVHSPESLEFPAAEVLKAITPKTRLICVANPNNPTGAIATREQLLAILHAAPQAAVLIDEAYIHFGGESLIDQIERVENLFVSRTFSKAYGLAGFRLGALIGATAQMKMLRRVASPYNVNGIALTCLPAALDDREYLASYIAQVLEGRSRLERFYRERNIPYWPSQASFVLAYFGDYREAFVQQMRERGILVRDRNSDPGCEGCVRITLGNRLQTQHLLRELPEALASIGFVAHPRPALTAKEAQ